MILIRYIVLSSRFLNIFNKCDWTLTYWIGVIKQQIRDIVIADWMPEDIDSIPLQIWDPNEDCDDANLQMVVYRDPPGDGDAPAAPVV